MQRIWWRIKTSIIEKKRKTKKQPTKKWHNIQKGDQKSAQKTSKHPEDVNAPKRLQGKRICPFYSSYSKTVPHKTIQIRKKNPQTWKKNYDAMKSSLSCCRLKPSRILSLQRHLSHSLDAAICFKYFTVVTRSGRSFVLLSFICCLFILNIV